MNHLKTLLQTTIDRNASDLHIIPGYFPNIRVDGNLFELRTMDGDELKLVYESLISLLSDQQKNTFASRKSIDFAIAFNNQRFRVNYYYSKQSVAAAFRLIPSVIRPIEELSLPNSVSHVASYNDGLVIITGPTGEGKTTTLASIINTINLTQSRHIITIEDPIEYVYPFGKSIVSQRELGKDTLEWSTSVENALREDPDVILIGEMRDPKTMQAALTAAETGHLVMSTLHTSTTVESINRIIDMFSEGQQNMVRNQLSKVLKMVISQRLIPHADGSGRIPAVEMLYNTTAVSTSIRENKLHLLDNIIVTNQSDGMVYFEKYLASLVHTNKITKQNAEKYALRPGEIDKFL